MSRSHKKPGLLYRIFFKDPYKDSYDLPEEEWQPNPLDEWPEEIPAPPYLGTDRPFGAAPTLKRWVKLKISSDELNAQMELQDFPIEIGSSPCSLQLNDKGINPRHAIMDLHNGVLTITDNHSKNGVSVGSAWLNPGVCYPVNPGDIILIGRTNIKVIDYARHPQQNPAPQTEIYTADDIFEAMDEELGLLPALEEEPEQEVEEEIIELPPLPEPEPINKRTTLVKLMDEPEGSLLYHVLDMKEPVPIEKEQPVEKIEIEEIEIKEIELEEIEEIMAVERIEEPKEIEIPDELIKEEQHEDKFQDKFQEIFDELPEVFTVDILDEPPIYDLSTDDFIEALIEKSTTRPIPSWKTKEQPKPAPIIEFEPLPELKPILELEPISEPTPDPEPIPEPEPLPTPSPKPQKICSKCNTSNQENDKFCGACGTPLIAEKAVKSFCGQCGTKNTHNLKFCGECGYKLMS